MNKSNVYFLNQFFTRQYNIKIINHSGRVVYDLPNKTSFGIISKFSTQADLSLYVHLNIHSPNEQTTR